MNLATSHLNLDGIEIGRTIWLGLIWQSCHCVYIRTSSRCAKKIKEPFKEIHSCLCCFLLLTESMKKIMKAWLGFNQQHLKTFPNKSFNKHCQLMNLFCKLLKLAELCNFWSFSAVRISIRFLQGQRRGVPNIMRYLLVKQILHHQGCPKIKVYP